MSDKGSSIHVLYRKQYNYDAFRHIFANICLDFLNMDIRRITHKTIFPPDIQGPKSFSGIVGQTESRKIAVKWRRDILLPLSNVPFVTIFAVLDAYLEVGGNSIDTADVYSTWVSGHEGGESEGNGNRVRRRFLDSCGRGINAPDLML
jgi:hypothetical protein